ncbi:MAG: HD-GYP domain-containing protein [Spirochaetes bacterium]|nr:HD-GYP domain-containing protein [Spirochaetota bacterium]
MKKIPVEDLKPGMIFDKPVYIDSSNMLVPSNSPIKESDIKKLMKWGVAEVETAGMLMKAGTPMPAGALSDDSEKKIIDEYHDLLKRRKRLIEVHSHARGSVNSIYNCIRKDKVFATRELEESVTNIINLLQENNNVFLFLYGLDEGKDYSITHAVNVTFYAIIIGMALKYSRAKLNELGLGTLLIDSGMVKMPVYIVHKQSNLTEQEFNQIKTHPILGYKALRDLGQIKESVANITLQHHEQYDGKGYPRGLKGNDIDEYARISAIADSYEAQISNRSYKKKVYFYHAMRNLLSSGVNKFDPVILRVFLSRMSVYPIGSIVGLNDSSIAIIIGSIPEKPLRPIIKLIFDRDGKRIEDTQIINLIENTSLYILKAIDENEIGVNIFEVL